MAHVLGKFLSVVQRKQRVEIKEKHYVSGDAILKQTVLQSLSGIRSERGVFYEERE